MSPEEVEMIGWGSRAILVQRMRRLEPITAEPSASSTYSSPLQSVSGQGLGETHVQIEVCKGNDHGEHFSHSSSFFC